MPAVHRDESYLSLDPHSFHRIAYSDWGDPRSQHVVVCVHGMTRNSGDFLGTNQSPLDDLRFKHAGSLAYVIFRVQYEVENFFKGSNGASVPVI